MAREQYVVVRDKTQWRISFSGNLYGFYPTIAEATAVAIDTAGKAVASGLQAEVLVEGDDGGFRTAWTQPADPARPAS
jgi:hypothetical protein